MTYEVTEDELQKIINGLQKDKAPGPDGITNEVLRIVTPIIPKELAQAVTNYLATGLPDGLKELFIFMLRKEGKKNYLLSGAYRPIALKNTFVKLVNKVIIIYIIEKAEAELLLT